jgi:hypothetical protein
MIPGDLSESHWDVVGVICTNVTYKCWCLLLKWKLPMRSYRIFMHLYIGNISLTWDSALFIYGKMWRSEIGIKEFQTYHSVSSALNFALSLWKETSKPIANGIESWIHYVNIGILCKRFVSTSKHLNQTLWYFHYPHMFRKMPLQSFI